MRVIVTGGAGYIGSHTVLELLNQEHNVCIVDNFSNSSSESIKRIKVLTGKSCEINFLDIRETNNLISVFKRFKPDLIIHIAGLKSVGDSVNDPINYYDNNIFGSLSLLKAMDEVGCKKIIFSSSATVYGLPKYLPLDEDHPCYPINPYGRTKLFIEEMIKDWVRSSNHKSAIILRYFNPVGAHSSALIGENPQGTPNNLMPFVSDVASGKRPFINIYGKDYNTRDGTGERDYVHVVDLAEAHVASINQMQQNITDIYNIGTGKGTTVLELIKQFELSSRKDIKMKFVKRRSGDAAITVASVTKAFNELNWKASRDLENMCSDEWRWQLENPNGYLD